MIKSHKNRHPKEPTILQVALISAWCLFIGFVSGIKTHEYYHGSVDMKQNIFIKDDPLNRGQYNLDIRFPHGVEIHDLKMPGGITYPDYTKPRWIKILPDGRKQTWLTHLNFEVRREQDGHWENTTEK